MNNLELIEEMQNQLKKIFDELKESVKEEKPKREDGTMYLGTTVAGNLEIVIEGFDYLVGRITSEGRCYIMSCEPNHKAWQYWYENGKKIDETSVRWRGKEYIIERSGYGTYLKKLGSDFGYIYNFYNCQPAKLCGDDNIQTFSNGTVKIF